MKKTTFLHKFISLLLTIVLVVGILPINARASSSPVISTVDLERLFFDFNSTQFSGVVTSDNIYNIIRYSVSKENLQEEKYEYDDYDEYYWFKAEDVEEAILATFEISNLDLTIYEHYDEQEDLICTSVGWGGNFDVSVEEQTYTNNEWHIVARDNANDTNLFLVLSNEYKIVSCYTSKEETNENTTEFAGGRGTELDPYKISTLNQLCNVSKYLDAYYILINDITVTSSDRMEDWGMGDRDWGHFGWAPIGGFTGVFDGNGYTISGLYMSSVGNSPMVAFGLFGYSSGTIKNLTIKDSTFTVTINGGTGGSFYVGGIVGYQSGGKIVNCSFDGNITASTSTEDYYLYTAGIVGGADTTTISYCKNKGNIYVTAVSSYSSDDICGYLGDSVVITTKDGYYTYDIVNGNATITDVDTTISGNINIPSNFGRYSITSIGDRVFENCTALTSVTIPNSVTSIGYMAFCDCSSLASITIGNSVTSIGYSAFWGTAYYKNSANWEDKALYIGNCLIGLKSYYLPATFTIKNGTKTVADDAFSYCDFESITIPDSVTNMGNAPFSACDKLTYINVDSNNQNYASVDGVLFNKDKTKIIRYPEGKTATSYTIPSSVTSINNYAFSRCSSLTSITIPNGVTSIDAGTFYYCDSLESIIIPNGTTSIGYQAFYECYKLKNIWIPKSVTRIGNRAFYGCANLETIWFAGTEQDKNSIIILDTITSDKWSYNACLIGVEHSYDNTCDTTCNACDYVRTITHIYDNNCDTTCNVCGQARTTTHTYDNDCDAECNICGDIRVSDTHKCIVFSNNLSKISTTNSTSYPFALSNNVYSSTNKSHDSSSTFTITALYDCAFEIEYRTSTEKDFDELTIKHNSTTIVISSGSTSWQTVRIDLSTGDNMHITYSKDGSQSSYDDAIYFKLKIGEMVPADTIDANCDEVVICDICGEVVKEAAGHSYDNDCDINCNACGNIRTVPDHVYDNTCDTTCNVCSNVRTITHTYDNNCDAECNICGDIRTPDVHKCIYFSDNLSNISITNATSYPFSLSNGVYCSTNKSNNSSSTFTIRALYDCTLKIEYYTSTETNYDKLTIKHNSTTKVTQSGATSWETISIELSEGDYVYIIYSKDGSQYSYKDTIYFKIKTSEMVVADTVDPTCEDAVICDVCGEVVEAATGHSYDNACDTSCNTCAETRNVKPHNYSISVNDESYHWNECDCGAFDTKISHSYDTLVKDDTHHWNECACGAIDNKIEHTYIIPKYDNLYHWNECLCGAFDTKIAHTYNIPTKDDTHHWNECSCGAFDTKIEHTYNIPKNNDSQHWDECSCGAAVNFVDHSYDNACDTTCNICNAVRKVEPHKYFAIYFADSTKHWKECAVCGVKDDYNNHKYSNNCDTTCNICGATRKVGSHKYDNNCDAYCNYCNAKRTVGNHKYDNNCDAYCNYCNAKRSVPAHKYTKVTTVKATTSKDGYVLTECSVCGVDKSKTTIYYPKTVKLSTTSYTYNGSAKKPSVTVKDSKGKTISSKYYTVTYASGRKYVGKYKVTVKFKGNYSGTKTLYFEINPAKTTLKKVTGVSKSIKVYVNKKTTQVSGYQIQYSTSKKFTSAKTKTISSAKTTSATIKSLKAKKTYYVRVRTYKTVNGKKYYSGWSTYKSTKTK